LTTSRVLALKPFSQWAYRKSQVAIKYAYWYRRNFPDDSLFWIYAGTSDRFRQALLEIGTELQIRGFNDPTQNRIALVRDHLRRDTSHRWLMIIDNADDPDMFHDRGEAYPGGGPSAGLSKYIPDCEHGGLLVTTRDLTAGRRLAEGDALIRVEKMTTNESIEMLRIKLGDATSVSHPDGKSNKQ
jgi:hypothetical protein